MKLNDEKAHDVAGHRVAYNLNPTSSLSRIWVMRSCVDASALRKAIGLVAGVVGCLELVPDFDLSDSRPESPFMWDIYGHESVLKGACGAHVLRLHLLSPEMGHDAYLLQSYGTHGQAVAFALNRMGDIWGVEVKLGINIFNLSAQE